MRHALNKPMNIMKQVANNIALEMIEFQDNKFGISLETVLTELQSKIIKRDYVNNKIIRNSEEVKQLSILIEKRLGLKTEFVVNSGLAAILPFYPNKNHIFLDDMFRGNISIADQNKIIDSANNKEGFVDIEKAKVSGIFSEYINTVYLNFYELFVNLELSPAEVTAILLHELGHAFYSCEYSDRFETVNLVLTEVSKQISNKKKDKNLSYIFREIQSINDKVTEEDVDKIINGNRVVAGYLWFRVVIGSVQQQMKHAKYDETNFEQMADNFAARFNYGTALVSGLDKLHVVYISPEKNKTMRTFSLIMSLLNFSILAYASLLGFILPGMIGYSVFMMILFVTSIFLSGEDMKDYTYDELRTRYARIRNEYVAMLKTLDLDNKNAKTILDNIETIDRVINDTMKYRDVYTFFSNLIFKRNRNALSAIEEQKLLEEFAFNDLFIKSAQLKTKG